MIKKGLFITILVFIAMAFGVSAAAPNTTQLVISSSSLTNYTNENINCYAKGEGNITLIAYYEWYKNEIKNLTGSTPINNDTLSLIATLTSGNTTKNDIWTCSVLMSNGSLNETGWNNETITIKNAPPNLTANIPAMEWIKNNVSSLNLTSYFTDIDGDNLTYTGTVPANITVSINNVTGIVNFTPNINFTGASSIIFYAFDADGLNATSNNVTLNVSEPRYEITIIPSPIDLGTISQNGTYNKSFTVTNSGNATLTNINVTPNAAAKYNITLSQTALFSLDVNENKTIMVYAFISEDENTGNHTFGSLSILSDQRNFSVNLAVNVKSKLSIKEVDVDVGDESDNDLANGETISKKAEPNDLVQFRVDVENLYTDKDDIDIDDVTITVTIEGIDKDDDDLEEESRSFDLEAEDSNPETISFTVPLEVKEDSYEVTIKAEGTDDNGVEHSDEWTLHLTVDKDSHKIIITKAELGSSTLSCARSTDLNVEILNIGARDEDEVVLEIKSSSLGLNIKEANLNLDAGTDEEDNRYSKSVPINLAKDFAAGAYPIIVKVYYSGDIPTDSTSVSLVVEDCPTAAIVTTPTETPATNQTVVVTTTPTTTTTTTTGALTAQPITPVTEVTFIESKGYFALLVLANIIILGALFLIVAKLLVLKRI